MEAEKFATLKRFVGERCRYSRRLRDELVEIAVEEFPADAPDEMKGAILRERLRERVRERYGSVIAIILIGVLVNVITRLILEWWFESPSHRVIMQGWARAAQGS